MAKVRVFTSFDFDHDEDLRNLLVGQSRNGTGALNGSASSELEGSALAFTSPSTSFSFSGQRISAWYPSSSTSLCPTRDGGLFVTASLPCQTIEVRP